MIVLIIGIGGIVSAVVFGVYLAGVLWREWKRVTALTEKAREE